MARALAYLLFSIFPVLVLVVAEAPLVRLQDEFHDAIDQYQNALQFTRQQMVELGHELKTNSALAQDLKLQSYNSASRILSGFASPGKSDYWAISDRDCRYLAHSEQGMLLSSNCSIQNLEQLTATRFEWQETKQGRALQMVMPLSMDNQSKVYLLSSTSIHDAWLQHFPKLQQSFRDLDIHINDKQGRQLAINLRNQIDSGMSAGQPPLYSEHILLKFYPKLLENKSASLNRALSCAIVIFLLALANLYRVMIRQKRQFDQELNNFNQWVHQLMPEGSPGSANQPGGHLPIEQIKEHIDKVLQKNQDQLQKCQQHSQSLASKVVKLEAQVMDKKIEQAFTIRAESLHQQMQSAASSYLRQLSEALSLGEDIAHLAANALVRPAHKMFELSQKWNNEMSRVPPRKMVRSMAERVDASGVSELEKELSGLLESSAEIRQISINMALLAQRLTKDLGRNLQLAEHWHQLMDSIDQSEKSLAQLLDDSQKLIELAPGEIQIHYEQQINAEFKLNHLHIPDSLLYAIFYHCQMALIEIARSKNWSQAHILGQIKHREQKNILVLSLRGPADDELSAGAGPLASVKHFQLAQQLLQNSPLSINRLPTLQGIHAIALIWESALKKDSEVEKAKGEQQRELIDSGSLL